MDGAVKQEPDAAPTGKAKAEEGPAAGRAGEGVAGREEKLLRLYMDLTGCTENEARCTYMLVHRAGTGETGRGG